VIGWLIVGAGCGLGLTTILLSLAPARPPLGAAIAALRRPPPPRLVGRQRLLALVGSPLRQLGLPTTRMRADLAICDRDLHHYLASIAGLGLLGLLAPPATVAALNALGAGLGFALPLWLGAALGTGGVVVSIAGLREDAEDRRLMMRHTLAALLDVIPPALAAGAGVEQAITNAASIADGWAADRIRNALDTARITRVPLWQPLRQLGETTGVVQLEQLAGTLQLAAGEGTRIREALTQRGEALSERLTAEMEARAEAATERMSIPLMALTSVFLLFLIYPALAALKG
jgi:Flp pilus assembly protein TadB